MGIPWIKRRKSMHTKGNAYIYIAFMRII